MSIDSQLYYNEKAKTFGHSHKAVGWYSDYTQEIRFLALSMVGDLNDSVIMDVGCGQGDFKAYCDTQGFSINYTGCDISDEMITIAKKNHPNAQFIHSPFQKLNLTHSVDYVIASGLLSLKSDNPYHEYHSSLKTFLSWARKGVALNFLSDLGPESQKDRGLFNYYSPSKIVEYTKDITPYFELNHRYLDNDFTILVFPN